MHFGPCDAGIAHLAGRLAVIQINPAVLVDVQPDLRLDAECVADPLRGEQCALHWAAHQVCNAVAGSPGAAAGFWVGRGVLAPAIAAGQQMLGQQLGLAIPNGVSNGSQRSRSSTSGGQGIVGRLGMADDVEIHKQIVARHLGL